MAKEVKFGVKPKPFMRDPPQHHMSKHARHEAREGAYGEYEEEVKEHAAHNPANPRVKSVSLWTLHSKGK